MTINTKFVYRWLIGYIGSALFVAFNLSLVYAISLSLLPAWILIIGGLLYLMVRRKKIFRAKIDLLKNQIPRSRWIFFGFGLDFILLFIFYARLHSHLKLSSVSFLFEFYFWETVTLFIGILLITVSILVNFITLLSRK
jgi:hypothetical protein